eukprot:2719484-Pyramimonas_sp.AAC.1
MIGAGLRVSPKTTVVASSQTIAYAVRRPTARSTSASTWAAPRDGSWPRQPRGPGLRGAALTASSP